ncbi:MAG: hypothetical protein Q9225_007722 [Loekoesia sp. 1 TL-2023]
MAENSTPSPGNTQSPLRLIQLHAPELRVAILSNVPNLQTLRSLILSCSAFSTVYYSYQRQILLHLARNAFDIDSVNIAIPLLACRAQHLDVLALNHLETVTTLLKANPEHSTLTKQSTLEITIEECKQMLQLKDVATQICSDLIAQMPFHHPLGKENVMSQKPLSTTERCRITTAIYRWELWAGLFSQRTRSAIQKQDPAARVDLDAQTTVYRARYTRWEQEQLGCLYEYALRRYRKLFDESAKWFDEDKGPGPFDPAEDLNPWFMLHEYGSFAPKPTFLSCKSKLRKLTFLSIDFFSDDNQDKILGRGPQLLAALLSKTDTKWRCDTIITCIHNFDPCFGTVVFAFIPRKSAREAKEEDRPYGYRWALANLKPGDPSLVKACDFLWHWGYAFWDEDRLRNWGFEIDGPFYYTEVYGTYPDEKDGIRDRESGRLLQEPQFA